MEILWAISEIRTPFLDKVFSFLTQFGESAILVVLLALVFWCVDKKLAYRIGFGFFFSTLVVNTVKITARVPRPWVKDPNFAPVEGATTASTGYSFPSGHTQAASSVYSALAFGTKNKFLHIICIFLISSVAFSRIYLGVHTPSDVLWGLAIGLIFSISFQLVSGKKSFSDILPCAALIISATLCCLYAFFLYAAKTVELEYLKDIMTASGSAWGFALSFLLERKYIAFEERRGNILFHSLKTALGLAVTLGLKSGLKVLLGSILIANFIRYFIIILWIMLIYPLLLNQLFKKYPKDTLNGNKNPFRL